MKKIFTIIICLSSFSTVAGDYRNMKQGDMAEIMRQAEQMQKCMRNISQEEMAVMQGQAAQMQMEIKQLCKAGKRKEAMQRAMGFGREISQSSTMTKMKQCGQMIEAMMAQLPRFISKGREEDRDMDICNL